MGKKIYNDLHQAGVDVFITDKNNAKDAAELYVKNELINKPELGCNHWLLGDYESDKN